MSSRTLVLIALVAPLAAAEPPAGWQVEASPAFATTGDIKGPAGGVTVLRALNGWFALGATVDSARLSASGATPQIAIATFPTTLGGPYSYAVVTTFAGAVAQFRLSLGRFVASADLAAGWNEVRQLYSYNTQCGYGSGFNIRLGTGLAVAATEHLLLGVRAAVRPPAYSAYCLAMAGPWSFGSGVLSSVGPTVSLRF